MKSAECKGASVIAIKFCLKTHDTKMVKMLDGIINVPWCLSPTLHSAPFPTCFRGREVAPVQLVLD